MVRHGQVEENAKAVLLGWLDVDLNDVGLRQAADAADEFVNDVQAIFCSDLRRCQQTAAFFRTKLPDLPFFFDWRLRERYFGAAQGRSRSEAFPDGAMDVRAADAESIESHRDRLASFVMSLKQLEPRFSSALVVTHNGSINRLMEIAGQTDGFTLYENGNVVELDI